MKINTTTDGLDVGETVKAFSSGQRLLNRYKLERVLGQGGMGVVWLARDEELERDIAMKFLPAIFVNDRASLLELKRETRRSLELTHPNIVRTYDFVQDSTIAGISMEYVDNETLRNRRLDQPNGVFTTEQIAPWIRQLCSALDYAHFQAAIVHRDLKPANLMVNGRDQLKIADFGISRSLVESMSTLTAHRGVSGTLVYMSPQQLSGEPSTAADDIYALGATLYELLTTRPPFYTGDVAGQVHSKIAPSLVERRQSLGIPAGKIPLSWEKTIAECLAKDPAQRPRSAGEVAVQLGLATAAEVTLRTQERRPAPAPEPGEPRPVEPSTPTSGWRTATTAFAAWPARKKRIALGSLAAALLLSGGGYFAAKQRAEADRIRQTNELRVQHENEEKAAAEKQRLEAARIAALRGGIKLSTDPAEALVKVGDLPPQTATGEINDIKLGPQTVEISLDGYESVRRTVEVVEGAPVDLGLVELKRSKGYLKIVSTPPDLTCKVQSKNSPLTEFTRKTPIDGRDLPTGEYEVTVTRPGWPEQTRIVTLGKGPPVEEPFDFPGGRVSLTSEPTGAKVLIGKEEVGKTPYDKDDLPPGKVAYVLKYAGYEDATVNGTIEVGDKVFTSHEALHRPASKIAATKPKTSGAGTKTGGTSSGRSTPPRTREAPSGPPAWTKYLQFMPR